MAGMNASTASMGNVECDGISSTELVTGIVVPPSSSLSVQDGGMGDAVVENGSEQGVVSHGTTTMEDGQLKPVTSDLVPDSYAVLEYVQEFSTSDYPSGVKGVCIDALGLERGKNLTEIRGTKVTQVCAICHDKIKVEETAELKGCEHSYCVTCILRWASYKTEPWCPQCRLPFSFLYVYRNLDGSFSDYLQEESVCLLLRAFWFKPLVVQESEEQDDYQDDYDAYEESFYTSSVRLGNRRWGDSGYVRAGRLEARPFVTRRQFIEAGGGTSSSSRQAKGKEQVKEVVGRRARRTQKREQLDKMSGKK